MPADLVAGEDVDDVAAYVAQCVGEAPRKLEVARAAAAGNRREGLNASLGGVGGHSIDGSAASGPTLKGVFTSMVRLASGHTVKADEQYLLESAPTRTSRS